MNWPMCISEEFAKDHAYNQSGAKFKIHERVIFRGKSKTLEQNENIFTITGISCVNNDDAGNPIFEYSLRGFPYLIWEHEIEEIWDEL